MANPIIKIKRGFGVPNAWDGNPTNPTGITFGEFAFDKGTGLLYLGVTGAYVSGSAGIQGNAPTVIAIGAQISDDQFFGSGGDGNVLGDSAYTIPTTRAVRAFVLQQKADALLGITFQGGPGITLSFPEESIVQINNTGALEAFSKTQLQANGGVVSGDTSTTSIGSTGGILKYIARSGIAIDNDVVDGTASIGFANIGVTGIGGFTGNITSIVPIRNLSGSTGYISEIANKSVYLVGSSPILVAESLSNTIFGQGITTAVFSVTHQNVLASSTSIADPTFGGLKNGIFYVPAITMDSYGHIKRISEKPLFTDGVVPTGLTELVQDIVGDSEFLFGGAGIDVNYVDGDNTLTITNTGVVSIKDSGNTSVNGNVTIDAESGSGLTISANANTDTITIGQNIPYFKNVQASKGATSRTIVAEGRDDTLGLVFGSGMSFSADIDNDQLTLVNDGVVTLNGLKGAVALSQGNNIELGIIGNAITISSLGGGGDGSIGSVNAQYEIDGTISATGVTGFVSIEGITHGQGYPTPITYNKNIVTYRSDNSLNGDIFVDLSSNIKLPSSSDGSNGASITIPPKDSVRQGPSYLSEGTMGNLNYADNGIYTPFIYAGMTGPAILEGNGSVDVQQETGKELILKAGAGGLFNGQTVSTSKFDALFVLSGYPTNNNFVNYMVQSGWNVGPCSDSNCVGFPPVLPGCDSEGDNNNTSTTDVNRGSATIIANTIIDGALAIEDDIYLRGNIYNQSGCKLDIGAASQASNYFDECGTLRNPGGIYLNGTVGCDADSDRAIFNVSEFFIKDRLVTIGGASGNQAVNNSGLFGTTMDVGFLMPSYLNGAGRTAFIGIDTSAGTVGTFKYLTTVGLSNGQITTGTPGPAEFASINGISFADNITVNNSVRDITGSIVSGSERTGISSSTITENKITTRGFGHINFYAPDNPQPADASNISLGQAAWIGMGDNSSLRIVNDSKLNSFVAGNVSFGGTQLTGITFDAIGSSDFRIIRKNASNVTATYQFPFATSPIILADIASAQIFTRKTIGDDCVIDCGSY